MEEIKKEILNAPNNIIRGRIEIDTVLLNNLYYKILFNAQRDNRRFIIKPKKVGEKVELTKEQEELLEELDKLGYLTCRLTFEDIENIIKRRNERTQESILEKVKILQGTVFRFATGEHYDKITQTQLIGEVEEKDYGYDVHLSAKLYKYLFYNIGIGYTPINLLLFFSFKSNYTRSLYAYLRSWSGTKREITVDLKTLREDVFCLAENNYREYKKFNDRVLKKAIEDINESGSMKIEVEETKNNKRKVCSITFKIKDYEPRVIEREDAFGEEEDIAVYWLDTILVQNQKLKEYLEKRYEEYALNSEIVKSIFIKAYEKTIATDKNKTNMLINKKGNSNLALFDKILTDEFTMNEIAFLNGFY